MCRGLGEVLDRFHEHFTEVLQAGSGSVEQDAMDRIEADVRAIEAESNAEQLLQQVVGGVAAGQDYGAEPSIGEVQYAVKALRNGAAAGLDGIVAPLLKAGSVVTHWLHRVICAVWRAGRAPVDWKHAVIVPLYKGKGDRKSADNYRGISLLSIPGKVYATILMRRVYEQVDNQLLDAQSAFRKGRGIGDAVFTLRMTMARCREFNVPLHMAFVDLRKAYDSVPRSALWLVLRKYGVHGKLLELLQDLHVGTQAAVKLNG